MSARRCVNCGKAIRWAHRFGWVHRVSGGSYCDTGSAKAQPDKED